MVYVTDGAHIDVGLVTFKFLFSHFSIPLQKIEKYRIIRSLCLICFLQSLLQRHYAELLSISCGEITFEDRIHPEIGIAHAIFEVNYFAQDKDHKSEYCKQIMEVFLVFGDEVD